MKNKLQGCYYNKMLDKSEQLFCSFLTNLGVHYVNQPFSNQPVEDLFLSGKNRHHVQYFNPPKFKTGYV